MSGTDPRLLLGTTKGAFVVSLEGEAWRAKGPYCECWPINHVISDPESGRIWAGGGGDWEGAGIWYSDDLGQTWDLTRLTEGARDEWLAKEADAANQTFPPLPFGDDFGQIWSLGYAHGVLYAGTKPAKLLRSRDGGVTWEQVDGLSDHPSANSWNPGAAGLVLHTIVPDRDNPMRMWIGVSAAGVFVTQDAGETWERRNRISEASASAHEGHDHPAAPKDGDTGHCVHNMMHAAGQGDVLFQQNHHGVWRSSDGGLNWDDITAGLPSTFGFPIRVHPRDPDTVWTLPLNGDSVGRYPPDAAAAVWKSTDGGQSWQAKREGLPQQGCFFTVLRQAMAGDSRDPAGLFFGTNNGSVFASFDEGETWEEIIRHLPTILSVEAFESG